MRGQGGGPQALFRRARSMSERQVRLRLQVTA